MNLVKLTNNIENRRELTIGTPILIVDDNLEILDILEYHLTKNGYTVHSAKSALEAMQVIRSTPISLAILDVMLPKINGFELCQSIRKEYFFPVLFLTAKGHEDDKIKGLMCGGDDYMLKPFSSKELIARVSSLLRRMTVYNNAPEERGNVHTLNNLTLDECSAAVKVNGNLVELTDIEYKILLLLFKNRGECLSTKDLFEKIWGELFTQTSNNTVVVHIKNIRKKLMMHDSETEYIRTVWGKGYAIY